MSEPSQEQIEAFEEESRLRHAPITEATKARIAELTAARKAKGLILPNDHMIRQMKANVK